MPHDTPFSACLLPWVMASPSTHGRAVQVQRRIKKCHRKGGWRLRLQVGASFDGLGMAMAIGSLAGKLSFNASSSACSAWLSPAGVGESRSGGGAGAVAALVLECMVFPSQSLSGNAMRRDGHGADGCFQPSTARKNSAPAAPAAALTWRRLLHCAPL